jgi:hypothetical protein
MLHPKKKKRKEKRERRKEGRKIDIDRLEWSQRARLGRLDESTCLCDFGQVALVLTS